MESAKTKSLRNIEEKIENITDDSVRRHVLECAKNFKISWIDLGRALYSVWKDKLFKEWGYGSLDIYTAKEIGIKKQTAMKLLRSYYFLEKEEPVYLEKGQVEVTNVAKVPNYESIDVLRLAKNKKALGQDDYAILKKEIFEEGKDAREVKRDLASLMRQREELDPEEAFKKRKFNAVKRLLGNLNSLKKEMELLKLLPSPLLKDLTKLINDVNSEVS